MGKSDKKNKKDKKRKKHQQRKEREAERKRRKVTKEEDKAQKKADETPEERRIRRLAKKQIKAEKQKEEKDLFGYTNDNNPFGDANLTKAFVWKKKYERETAKGVRNKDLTKQQLREKQIQLRAEVEKVKARRAQREIEDEQMEEMKLQIERDNMIEMAAGWEEKEEEFHRKQARARSEKRISEGREKAIDILAKNLYLFEDKEGPEADVSIDMDVELTEPHKIFDGLIVRDLELLCVDIKEHVRLKVNGEYWNALLIVCESEIVLCKKDPSSESFGLSKGIREDVQNLLDGKGSRQIEAIEKDIKKKIELGRGSRGEAIDIGYWETLLQQMKIFKAKAYLGDFHKALLKKRLRQLKTQMLKEIKNKDASDSDSGSGSGKEDWEPELIPHDKFQDDTTATDNTDEGSAVVEDDYEDGCFSPELCQDDSDDSDAVDPEQDKKQLEAQRRVVLEQKEEEEREAANVNDDDRKQREEVEKAMLASGMNRFQLTADEVYQKELATQIADDEEAFGDSESMETKSSSQYWWHDKYRPRKPRYFNRVRTGYDWNKYNQTHYDKENPPPKIVQGYKFNIFYPDLIDPTKPPGYMLEAVEGSADHQIIRFIAGAPYEDVAFKIVKKEWEWSHKRGFKCVFDRGVLHLYFNFRRFRYRR